MALLHLKEGCQKMPPAHDLGLCKKDFLLNFLYFDE